MRTDLKEWLVSLLDFCPEQWLGKYWWWPMWLGVVDLLEEALFSARGELLASFHRKDPVLRYDQNL